MHGESSRSVTLSALSGIFVLSIPAVSLILLGSLTALFDAQTFAISIVLLIVGLGTLLSIRFEWHAAVRSSELPQLGHGEMIYTVLAILWGTILALAVVVEFTLSPIVAAGGVGIVAAVFVPKYAVPAYCGAFVGMTSPELFTSYWHALLAGGFASGVFLLVQPVFYGVGGKLGTTAFVGATLTVITTSGAFQSGPLPGDTTIFLVVLYAVIGATVTFSIHARFSPDPVFASGVVGAAGGIILPVVYGGAGQIMAAGVFAASFAGMTDPKRIPNELWIALTGAIVGIVVIYTMPHFGGSGGKLGTVAFGSALAVHGFLGTLHIIRVRKRLKDFPRRDST